MGAEPALRCLELLTNVEMGQLELQRLLVRAEVKLPQPVLTQLEAMCKKAAKDEQVVNAVEEQNIQRASKQAVAAKKQGLRDVVLVSEDGTERSSLDDGLC